MKGKGMGFSRRSMLKLGATGVASIAMPSIVRAQGATLKIGVIGGYTGHLSAQASSTRRGVELFDRMHKASGGKPIEFMFFDSQSRPENGRTGAEKLIGDGATLIVGTGDSGATIAALQVCEQAKVPLVVDISAAPQITEQGYKYVFRNFPDAISLLRDAVRVIKDIPADNFKPQTAVLIHINDTFGQSLANGVNALWGRLEVPIKMLETIAYDPRARDLSAEIARVKALNPDLLMPVTRVFDAIQLVREMVKQDVTPQAIIGPGSPGAFEKEFTDALGAFGDYYMVSTPWYDPSSAMTKAVLAEFNKANPTHRFELNVGFAYEAAMIAADAYRRANSTQSAALHEALRATDISSHLMAGGPIKFNEKGHNPNIGSVLLQNLNRRPQVVMPVKIAEAKPVFPMPKWRGRT